VTVNDIENAIRNCAKAAGLDLSAAVVDAVAMSIRRFIRDKSRSGKFLSPMNRM
jgi:mevalonate pyrophosphate decarboxylase